MFKRLLSDPSTRDTVIMINIEAALKTFNGLEIRSPSVDRNM